MSTGKISFIIVACSSLLFFPFLGSVHLFDWDEINFAECAREMLVSKNYSTLTINYLPFWEKPPLFIWMQAVAMHIFGISEFAARLPNAICGVSTLLVLFHIGKKIKNQLFGIVWVLVYAGSLLPHFYFKSGIIDPWFNFFIFLGIYFFILHTTDFKAKNNHIFLSALFIGLAILTKGPVAFLIYALCVTVYWMRSHFKKIISLKQLLLFIAILVPIGGMWFIFELMNDITVIERFIRYQVRLLTTEDAGHGGPWYYHLLVLLFGCFPASIFALQAFRRSNLETDFQLHFKKIMAILFFVVLILFSIVKTKIVHYSSLAWFPLSYFAAYSIEKIMVGDFKWEKWMRWLTGVVGILIGVVLFSPILIDRYKEEIISSNLIKDEFAIENLKATVHWSGYEMLPGFFYITGIILLLLLIKRNEFKTAIISLFVISTLTVNTFSILVIPKIEKYSQAAAVEFYKNLRGKDCYVETLGFKSYAYLFYSYKKPQLNPNSHNIDWLLKGDTDKPVYFVSKITDGDEYRKNYPQLKELYKKHGFVFYRKE